jgi:hypothetical protein
MKLYLGHLALESEQDPVVDVGQVVHPVGVDQRRVGQPGSDAVLIHLGWHDSSEVQQPTRPTPTAADRNNPSGLAKDRRQPSCR